MKFDKEVSEKKQSQLLFGSDGRVVLPDSVKDDVGSYKSSEDFDEDDSEIWSEEDNLFDEKQYNLDEDVSGFNLFKDGERLEELRFSNDKTQSDVVREVLNLIDEGKRVIFIRGVCGTGKSAIALNIAKEIGKTSIVVPGKALQRQYHDDYSRESYVLKKNHKKLKIKVISGRQNHKCMYRNNSSADDPVLPCKIDIKESNLGKLKEYLRENPKVRNDLDLKEIRRMSVAPVCPYWSPIVPTEVGLKMGGEKREYLGLKGIKFTIYNRRKGCGYYNQFNSYIDAEAIVFNSAKYKSETLMNRKPATEVEIIDEGDEFLDSFSNTNRINFSRLLNSLNNVFPEDENLIFILDKIVALVSEILKDTEIKDSMIRKDIFELKRTRLYELFRYFLDNPNLVNFIDEDNYALSVVEVARDFEDYFDDSFVSFYQGDRGLVGEVVTTNLAKKFQEMLDKNKVIVMMSGTIHDFNVLKNVFGLENFEVVDAETINQGEVEVLRTGREFDCSYRTFSSGAKSREDYLVALDRCVEVSKKPTLIHVNAFDDLPSSDEKFRYSLNNLITKQELRDGQINSDKMVEGFKNGNVDVLFTTRCNRGVDFPRSQCHSIVFTKYPNPNVNSIFWKILNKTHPGYYWSFYKDKAYREFLQKIYRGVRSSDDHVYVLSPDSRVLGAVDKI